KRQVVVPDQAPSLSEHDVYLFREGTHGRLYRSMGCRLGADGASFCVWAPNATRVSVIGPFNQWDAGANMLRSRADGSGQRGGHRPRVAHGDTYKYRIVSAYRGLEMDKADPFAVYAEIAPLTASRAWSLDYAWSDGDWMKGRAAKNALGAPMSIYEVHVGSWRR